jgi:hypothetical protein
MNNTDIGIQTIFRINQIDAEISTERINFAHRAASYARILFGSFDRSANSYVDFKLFEDSILQESVDFFNFISTKSK